MKSLNISITKAQLKSYTITLEEGKPHISVTCELLTEGGKPITTYTASTKQYDWEATGNFELPLSAIQPIVDLSRVLEDIVVQHCRDSQLALGSGADADPITEEALEVITVPATVSKPPVFSNDEPIDLSEIPF